MLRIPDASEAKASAASVCQTVSFGTAGKRAAKSATTSPHSPRVASAHKPGPTTVYRNRLGAWALSRMQRQSVNSEFALDRDGYGDLGLTAECGLRKLRYATCVIWRLV